MMRRFFVGSLVLIAGCGAEPMMIAPVDTRELRGTVASRDAEIGAFVLAENAGVFVLAENTAIVDTSGSTRDADSLMGAEVRVRCVAGGTDRCVAQHVAILARGDASRPTLIEPPALD